MNDKYAILKKIAASKAREETNSILSADFAQLEKVVYELKLKTYEQDILIEELRVDSKQTKGVVQNYSEMLKKMPYGYVVTDQNGTIVDANQIGLKNIAMPSIDKAIGRPFALCLAYEDRARFLSWVSSVFGGYAENETTFKNSQNRTVTLRGSLLSGSKIMLIVSDVTDSQSRAKFFELIKYAIDRSNDSVVITDADVKIIYANDSFCRVTGYSKQEVLGTNPSILKSGIYDKSFYEAMWSSIIENGFWQGHIADRRKDGKISIHQTNITAIKNNDKIVNYIGIFSDITEQSKMGEKILELSIYDTLTRLPNRQLFKNKVEELCVSKFAQEEGFALLFIDLDNFKYVNDAYGHSFGDELLLEVSKRLKKSVRKSDFVARLGGDEFVVVLDGIVDAASIQTVAENIIRAVGEDVRLSIGQNVNVGSSIGISVYPDDARNYEDLVKFADIAMYKAKEDGKNRYCFYNYDLSLQSIRISKLKNILPGAQNYGEIYLNYQPLFCAATLKAVGAEALARWRTVQFGDISPFEFITLAEKTGIIKTLGFWLFKKACEEMGALGFEERGLDELAINISGVQIKEQGFVESIVENTRAGGLKPSNIVLEVTETMLIENLSSAKYRLEQLREMGFRVALDDFGTGYSSLSYLQKLPVDIIKIDKSFIDLIHKDKKTMDIVDTIIDLSHDLEKRVVAEGVEELSQAELLIEAKCDILQGYFFSKPVKAKYFATHMDASSKLPKKNG